MKTPVPERWWQRVGIFGLAYPGLGIISALLSNPLQPGLGQASIRVGILLIAIVVFYIHFRVEFARPPGNLRLSALLASGAVAIGTFLLALYAITAAWLETSQVGKSLLAALIIWPVATGVPAFFAALVLGKMLPAAGLFRRYHLK
jgi:hypothetical protein